MSIECGDCKLKLTKRAARQADKGSKSAVMPGYVALIEKYEKSSF